ncbi:MAG TPA: DUF1579 family protein [Thermoanaerobaculia bacterium]|nr:DUF1579 family protein [Thermoanaerobaculia bacterium]
MKIRSLIATLVMLAAWPVLAADAVSVNPEMRKLDWLVGEWKGEATVQMGPGPAQTVVQHERVQSKLDGKVLLIEGLGKRKMEDGSAGATVHDALAILSYNPEKKNYRFNTWLADRPSGEAVLEVTGPTTAVWGLETPRGRMRYTVDLTEKGEWLEIGEWSTDGTKWTKFIEMRLSKVK